MATPREELERSQGGPERGVTPRLHYARLTNAHQIRILLTRLCAERVPLVRALNRRILKETALIERVNAEDLVLRTFEFDERQAADHEWTLSVVFQGASYFFTGQLLETAKSRTRIAIPSVLFHAERRDRIRQSGGANASAPRWVLLTALEKGKAARSEVNDFSPGGIGLFVPSEADLDLGQATSVRYLDGERVGREDLAEIRNIAPVSGRPGWKRIGLAVRKVPVSECVTIERRASIGGESRLARAANRVALAASAVRAASGSRVRMHRSSLPKVHIVTYQNAQGEEIRAILDTWGEAKGAPVVVIPPAWGKTKETLLPLAATIIASFKRSGFPISVVRFDGVRRKGESYNDPQCRKPGREYLRFRFSQAVEDTRATLEFLFGPGGIQPSTAVLVSFSAASIDSRRAVALDAAQRLSGWINVVGAPDLQSAMRVVSGGVDYVGGFERGLRFGLQEIQGVMVDMDYAAEDAIKHRLGFLDDALDDMARIATPITWIHGRYDAWMDFDRVKLMMSAGNSRCRKLIEVPTGHQLRSSAEAIEVFQLIASEVGRMAGFGEIARGIPDAASLRAKGDAERKRLPRPVFEPKRFWRDYLVGRNGRLGIELMTATSAYQELMDRQVLALRLRAGDRVADLGSGTGAFRRHAARLMPETKLVVQELDVVLEALRYSRERARGFPGNKVGVSVVCDLSLDGVSCIPLRDASQDAVLASLLLSYVGEPERLLKEVRRVLRPGGRFVLSTLRPDADTSRIYAEGADELRSGRARELFGEEHDAILADSLQSFLNDAARLLDLEEQSVFRFFEADELASLLERVGFEVLGTERTFGTPPQAVVLTARRTD